MSTARKAPKRKGAPAQKSVRKKAVATKAAVKKLPAKKVATKPTAKKVAKPKRVAKKATAKSATGGRSAVLREARQFALQHNYGLSSRMRELLDSNKDALQLLVDENLPLIKVQEFIQQTFGPKVGVKALGNYLQANFKPRKKR